MTPAIRKAAIDQSLTWEKDGSGGLDIKRCSFTARTSYQMGFEAGARWAIEECAKEAEKEMNMRERLAEGANHPDAVMSNRCRAYGALSVAEAIRALAQGDE